MLDLFLSPFEGFDAADFAAYTEDKWASNLFNRPRMKVRDKLSAVGRHLHAALTDAGHHLTYEVGDFRPNVFNGHRVDGQWLFFTRPEEEQKKLFAILDREKSIAENLSDPAHHKRHLMLGLKVHATGIDAMLGLHRNARIDIRNGVMRLGEEWERDRLDLILSQMSDGALRLGIDGPPISELTAAHILQHLTRLQQGDEDWCTLGRRFNASEDAVTQRTFQDTLAATFLAFMPVYSFLAWSSDNDRVALRETIKTERVIHQQAEAGELEPGAEVTITAGLFSGKKGIVQEVDRKGMVRVSIGHMVVQVKGKALKPL